MPGPRRLPKPLRDKLLERARTMRSESTPAEIKLWSRIRGDQIGFRFRRQYRLGIYILDFFCPATRLVVEVDGDSHATRQRYDQARTDYLQSRHLQVIRFENSQVMTNLDEVVGEIYRQCVKNAPSPLPSPLPSPCVQGEGEGGDV
ncbi:MAG: endonuclease domain-containing protein [Phycisphaerales bacterium]|nr:endonuclease domain-containing protein [Phycisphaerales bacterium]